MTKRLTKNLAHSRFQSVHELNTALDICTPTSSASILCLGMSWFPSNPGGLDRYVYELTRHLAKTDQVELAGIDLPRLSPIDNLKLTNLAAENHALWQRLWSIRQHFKNRDLIRFDAVNLHFAPYSWPVLSALPKNVPVTFNFHGPWALESQQEGANVLSVKAKHWIETQVYRKCDRFIVLSQAFGQVLHENYGIACDRIHVVSGGVDTEQFQDNLNRQDARIKLGWPTDRFVLFTPRRLVHRMGIRQLLMALANIRQQVPDLWLAIAGKGPLKAELEQQAQELNLTDHVKFLGYLPDEDLPIAYQAADLTVIPSQSLEGFGLVLLESLACGTPAVCTPVGGMPEVIQSFTPELIFPSIEVDAIANHLVDCINGQIALPTRESCRSYAVDQFSWNTISQTVRKILLMSGNQNKLA